MYYCYNCRQFFDLPKRYYQPYPEHGGEPLAVCPHCLAPEMFERREAPWHATE